ncbi:hypothetical protein JW756_02655 [Candidatus Woesearchaeota archaeon]|nr:hypothetical protein [Candidatus Woesearchaeota archaeon]
MRTSLIALLIIIIPAMLLLSGCTEIRPEMPISWVEGANVSMQNNTAVTNESAEIVPAPTPKPSCEDWAKTLFPEQWVFKQDVTEDPKLTRAVLYLYQGVWKDKLTISGTSKTKIMLGSETGENIKYYYTKPIYVTSDQSQYGFSYYKKIIDEEGNVLGADYFKIRPVFKVLYDTSKDELNADNNTVKTRYLSLLMVEPNFMNCTRGE